MKDYEQNYPRKLLLKRSFNSLHPFLCAAKLPVDINNLPPYASNVQTLGDVYDQYANGSCFAFSGINGFESQYYKETGKHIHFSPLFLATMTRSLAGTLNYDEGASLDEMIKAFFKFGGVLDSVYGYDLLKTHPEYYFKEPPESIKKEALNNKPLSAFQIIASNRTSDYVNAAIASGYVVSFGIPVFKEFQSHDVACSGKVSMPKDGEIPEGGHAMTAYGYIPGWKRCRNQYGKSWGDHGDCLIPDRYFNEYFMDGRVISATDIGKPGIGL